MENLTENVMFVPAVILMVVELAAVVFLVCAWNWDKRQAEDSARKMTDYKKPVTDYDFDSEIDFDYEAEDDL